VNKFWFAIGFLVVGSVPLHAAGGFAISLSNTDFVVLIAFIVFIGAIIYFKAPKFVAKLIDSQIAQIERQLKEAADIRSEALVVQQQLEQKQSQTAELVKDLKSQADQGKELAIKEAEVVIKNTIERKIQNAREQLIASEAKAEKSIRDQAVDLAVNVAATIIQDNMGGDDRRNIISRSIQDIETRLN